MGFFYVLDRASGQVLAADKFVDANWVTHVDLKTGRPAENPDSDYTKGKPVIVFPSGVGGHNFNPMSLSARTGLVYLPTVHSGEALLAAPRTAYLPERMNTGVQIAFATQLLAPPETLPAALRPVTAPSYLKKVPSLDMHSSLKAWDPIAHKVVWEHKYASFMDHGGVLSTRGWCRHPGQHRWQTARLQRRYGRGHQGDRHGQSPDRRANDLFGEGRAVRRDPGR